MREMKLQDLKAQTPAELVSFAEEKGVENASTMRKQELMFAILKELAARDVEITGEGVVEVHRILVAGQFGVGDDVLAGDDVAPLRRHADFDFVDFHLDDAPDDEAAAWRPGTQEVGSQPLRRLSTLSTLSNSAP